MIRIVSSSSAPPSPSRDSLSRCLANRYAGFSPLGYRKKSIFIVLCTVLRGPTTIHKALALPAFVMINKLMYRSVRLASHNSQPLLPPLVLYRRILRQHKLLPTVQKEMGDQYVRNEFKLHKDIDNPLHVVGFLASWQDYLHMISNNKWKDATLSSETLEKLSPEQTVQLYELMKETQKINHDTETTPTKNIKPTKD